MGNTFTAVPNLKTMREFVVTGAILGSSFTTIKLWRNKGIPCRIPGSVMCNMVGSAVGGALGYVVWKTLQDPRAYIPAVWVPIVVGAVIGQGQEFRKCY
jgi:hypothetical protein